VEVEVLAGPPLWSDRGREVRHIVFGDPSHPIGADSLPLDPYSEIYLVRGVRDFIAANELYNYRSKSVYALPSNAPISSSTLRVFSGRNLWAPVYPGRAAAAAFEARRRQLHPDGEKLGGGYFMSIRLKDYNFIGGQPARSLSDLCEIYRELEIAERAAFRRLHAAKRVQGVL
jgi:hypothetical protein